jgi:hypothetical protein
MTAYKETQYQFEEENKASTTTTTSTSNPLLQSIKPKVSGMENQ